MLVAGESTCTCSRRRSQIPTPVTATHDIGAGTAHAIASVVQVSAASQFRRPGRPGDRDPTPARRSSSGDTDRLKPTCQARAAAIDAACSGRRAGTTQSRDREVARSVGHRPRATVGTAQVLRRPSRGVADFERHTKECKADREPDGRTGGDGSHRAVAITVGQPGAMHGGAPIRSS
jgi:hypothetical protein